MATKNIVPNDNGEGGIGVTGKRWSTAFINTVTGNVTGNLTGQVLTAAQTNINSILATDLIIGEDAQTAIDFGTVNEIDFKVDNANRLTLTSSVLAPATTNQIDLGTSSLEFKDAFFDGTVTADAFAGPLTGNVTGTADVATTVTITDNESTNENNAVIFTAGGDVDGGNLGLESDGNLTYNPSSGTLTATAFAGALTGNVTGNASGTAATVTGAAQGNITSLGTLTTLTVDDITINGSTISDAGDLLFDIGGDISLDAAGGDFIFLVGGNQYGKINFLGTNNLTISGSEADHAGLSFATHAILPAEVSATTDGTIDLGAASEQFKSIFLSGGVVVANNGTIGCAADADLLTLTTNTLTLTHANSGIFFQSVGPVNSDSSTNNFRMATYNNAANNIIPTAKTGFTAAGNAVFLGDTGVDIIMGTSNSSGAPSNSFIGLEHGGNVTMNAGASTPDIPAFKLDDADDITLTRGSLIIATPGEGIDFSAETPSGGGSGNTILDDYEEGTFTAAMSAGSGGTITLTAGGVDACTYTKIGRVINISGFFSVASVSSPSGRLKITGLPLTQVADGVPIGVAYINASNSYTGFGIMLGDTGTGVFIDRNSVNGATAATDLASAMKAGTEVYFNLTYTTNT